jgi:hypothetical protein
MTELGGKPPRRRASPPTPKSEPTVQQDVSKLFRDGLLLVIGVGLMIGGHFLEEWAAPHLGVEQRRIAHAFGLLSDTYIVIRLVGPNAFAVAEALVKRTTDLLVLIGKSWHRVRRAFGEKK